MVRACFLSLILINRKILLRWAWASYTDYISAKVCYKSIKTRATMKAWHFFPNRIVHSGVQNNPMLYFVLNSLNMYKVDAKFL